MLFGLIRDMGDTLSKDTLSKEERSARMSLVRSKGNKSTEVFVEEALTANGIVGWKKHPKEVPGKPDFYFPKHRLAVFVDGCFWHMCPVCGRLPKSRQEFWHVKIDQNRRRDNRTRRKLRALGYHTMRIWEHELKAPNWISRLRNRLARIEAMLALNVKRAGNK